MNADAVEDYYDDTVPSAVNASDADYEAIIANVLWPNRVERSFVAVLAAMMLVGVIGNGLVVFVVVSNKSMRSAMNIVLTNLAVADLLILLFCLPPTVINDVTKTFWFSTMFCKSVLFIQNTSVYVSVLSLVFITCERWRAITFPLKPPLFSTRYIIPAIWLLGMLLSLPEPFTLQLESAIFLRENFTTTWGTQCKESWSHTFQRKYQLAQAICAYIFPLLIISCLCLHMTRTLRLSRLTMARRQISSRKKAVRMLCSVVFLFALSNLPVHVYNIALSFDVLSGDEEEEINVNWVAFRKLAPRVFSYSSSCLNPILYSFMSGRFRKEFARVACCVRGGKKSREARRKAASLHSFSQSTQRRRVNTPRDSMLIAPRHVTYVTQA